jgi:3-hydroxybutyryl-CoA dehydratase
MGFSVNLQPRAKIEVGESASFTKTITETDVILFAGSTGDMNPFHINEEYARQMRFGRRIAHGMLVTGLISAVMGMKLPGPGTIYLRQELDFRNPVYIGDTITAVATVLHVREDKPVVTLSTNCYNQEGLLVVEGKAVVLVDQRPYTPREAASAE